MIILLKKVAFHVTFENNILLIVYFLVLPAAVITNPIFSPKRPQYLNYGALGTIIGHELSHGFGIMDSVKYEYGRKEINWSNTTFNDFFQAAECLLSDCNETGDENYVNVSFGLR